MAARKPASVSSNRSTRSRVSLRKRKLRSVQGFWSRKARERGLVTEEDLERYLRA